MAKRPTTVIEIRTTPKGVAQLKELFAAGRLKELGGVRVLEVGGEPQPPEERTAMTKYSFCETSTASAATPWHLRELGEGGPKYGGGIDTPFLCGRKRVNGWDLQVEITAHHLEHACKDCVGVYRKAAKG